MTTRSMITSRAFSPSGYLTALAWALGAGTTRTDNGPDLAVLDMGFHYPLTVNQFVRGDGNGDGSINIADPVQWLAHLFPLPGGPPQPLACRDACDGNDDGALNLADAVALLGALFVPGQGPLPAPNACGADPSPDALECTHYPLCFGP